MRTSATTSSHHYLHHQQQAQHASATDLPTSALPTLPITTAGSAPATAAVEAALAAAAAVPPTKKRKLVVRSQQNHSDHQQQRQQTQQRQRQLLLGIKPSEYALAAFRANGADIAKVQLSMEPTFQLPTQVMLDSYKPELLNLVRKDDLAGLQALHAIGKLVNCCNKFGESLLHLACRRGRTRVVRFLLQEADIHIHIRDDYLRTPLHDACWTCEPNFELVDMLIRHAPEHVVMSDARGFTPFDYVRKEHKGKWLRFLWERRGILKPGSGGGGSTTTALSNGIATRTAAAPTSAPLPTAILSSSTHSVGASSSKTSTC